MMNQSPGRFAKLLTQAIKTIHLIERKNIAVVQDELGYALGKKGGHSIEYWRKGNVPPKLVDIETLARELVKRSGLQNVDELTSFLYFADHPNPQSLIDELTPLLKGNDADPNPTPKPSTPNINPFIVGPPITEPHHFFGREEELDHIFTLWNNPPLQNVAVIGLKRSGKTSLLHYLRKITRTPNYRLRSGQRNNWLSQPERYRWVFVDFTDPRLGQQERLLRYLLIQLELPVPDSCNLDNFMDIIEERVQTPTIILMDEIGGGLESPKLDRHFWNSLRSLGTNYTNGNLGFLLTAHESPAQLARDEGKTSPFFNIFGHTLHLKPFTKKEALELINSSPQPFDSADVEWILDQSGRWPCLLQSLCYTRFASLDKGQSGGAWKEEAIEQIEPCRHLLESI